MDQQQLMADFLEILRLDSPSGAEEPVARWICARLVGLGLSPEVDAAGNVLAHLDGEGAPLLLNAHMDTVASCADLKPVVQDGVISSDGNTILGADDKAGIIVILDALQHIVETGSAHLPLELAFTVREESGLIGAKSLDYGRLAARWGLCLDATGPVGTFITAAPSQDSLDVTIEGRAAHAGVCPEQGISAIVVAAEAIAKMRLGRIDGETTANVGTIHGGMARNIVPDRLQLLAEARSHHEEKLRAQREHMVQALAEASARHGARLQVKIHRTYSAFRLGEEEPIARLVVAAAQRVGLTPVFRASGGGSDANIFNQQNIRTLCVAVGNQGAHSKNEAITVADLVKATELLSVLLRANAPAG